MKDFGFKWRRISVYISCSFIAVLSFLNTEARADSTQASINYIERLDFLWTHDLKSNYYSEANDLALKITQEDFDNGKQAYLVLENVLSRNVCVPNANNKDVRVIKILVLYLLSTRDQVDMQRSDIAIIVSRALGIIREELISDFQPKHVSLNIMPENVKGFAFAGMRPEAITDSEERERYIKALEQNRRNSQINQRQRTLKLTDWTLREGIIHYLIQAHKAGALPTQLLDKCIKLAQFDDTEISVIRKKGLQDAQSRGARLWSPLENGVCNQGIN